MAMAGEIIMTTHLGLRLDLWMTLRLQSIDEKWRGDGFFSFSSRQVPSIQAWQWADSDGDWIGDEFEYASIRSLSKHMG